MNRSARNQGWLLAAFVFAACEVPAESVSTESIEGSGEESSALSPSQLKVVRALAYGDSDSALYRKSGLLVAYSFTGRAGYQVTIDVVSSRGDPVTWLLDARYAQIASNDDAGEGDTSSHIALALPGNDPAQDATFYIAYRDYNYESHYFTVKIEGQRPRTKQILLTEDQCRSGRNRFLPGGENATPVDLALDTFCAELIISKKAPNGFVAIFGSSRLNDGTPEYTNARSFANQWTLARPDLPILTGGGPGIMDAGNRGAKEAGGVSLGFSTYFRDANDQLNGFVTDGYMFADFAVRERAMLNYAKAAVVYPGGVGTAWELFMTLSQVQTRRMNRIPIIVVGPEMANAFNPYLQWMATRGTISPQDVNLFQVVSTPEEALAALQAALPRTN